MSGAYYESFFSAEECDSILEKAKSLPLSEGTVTEELKVNHKIRRSEVSFINRRNSDFASVFSQLDYCVNEANDKWFGVDYNPTGAHYMQFTVYRGGQEGGENQFYGFPSGYRSCFQKLSHTKKAQYNCTII